MPSGKDLTAKVRILVKAYPQPSQHYEETVCCAGIRPATQEFLRLYPIRYRRLNDDQKFNRFDLVQMTLTPASDGRPESHRVSEDSIEILERATPTNPSPKSRVEMWRPFIFGSLTQLEESQKENKTSLGIIKPENVKFRHKPFANADDEDKAISRAAQVQASLLEDPLKPMEPPEFSFYYEYESGGKKRSSTIQDWEVQAAYFKFKRQYGDDAMEKLYEQYNNRIPKQNLHFIMGNMHKRPYQFILIGLLRSKVAPEDVANQGALF